MGLYLTQSYKEAHVLTKVALICLTGALYMGWYSFCTNSWGRVFPRADSSYFVGYGIWRIADNQGERIDLGSGQYRPPTPQVFETTEGWLLGWFAAFQAFATFGFISVNVGYVLVVLLVYVPSCKRSADLTFWNGITALFGCICWLVAVVLFGVKFDDTFDIFPHDDPTLQYSFILAVVVCALQLVAGILLLVQQRSAGSPSDNTTTGPSGAATPRVAQEI